MKIVFMGTPDFSVAALDALVDAGHEIVAVYTQPPRPAGRGKAPRPSPVQRRAEELGLPVRSPERLSNDRAQVEFAQLGADVAVVVAYGLLLPKPVLDAPKSGCLNIHASLLPRWRGAAPIQRAIMAGDKETGVCIMQMDEGLDTGPVRYRMRTDILPGDTAQSLHDRLSGMGASAIAEVLGKLEDYPAVEQSRDGACYAAKINKSEARIDWSQDATVLDRHIRGLSPFPGAWTTLRGERLKVILSELRDGSGAGGTVLDQNLTVACGSGAIGILRVQRAGKAAADTSEFLRGFTIPVGETFG